MGVGSVLATGACTGVSLLPSWASLAAVLRRDHALSGLSMRWTRSRDSGCLRSIMPTTRTT